MLGGWSIFRIRTSDRGGAFDGESVLIAALPQLERVAAQLTRGTPRVDPQDLLSKAVTDLYSQWNQGRGPQDNIPAYVSASMRNAMKDEWKSSRATEVPFSPDWEAPADPEPLILQAEVRRENEMLRQALELLTSDQRTVLLRNTLLGEKPRHLATIVDRPAPAVSSLLRRARIGLRRALVTAFVLEGAGSPECRSFADGTVVADYADSLLTTLPRHGHHRDCGACAASLSAVRDYAAAAAALDRVVPTAPDAPPCEGGR